MNDGTFLTEHGAQLSRRGFIAAGGVMMVGLASGAHAATASSAAAAKVLDPTKAAAWFEIHADNTLIFRTGKCDFGQSTIYTAYPQIIADELELPFESIKPVISGDTDRTFDGGGTFGLLSAYGGNLRKVSAYTREALIDLAAKRLGVPRAELSVKAGIVSGSGKSITYGQLVQGQELALTIPIQGNPMDFMGVFVGGKPPLKPVSSYSVVGKPLKNASIRPKMAGQVVWAADVRLPGMLHGRVIHPATLGSQLVAPGKLDARAYPGARVVVLGNLLGVVAPTEWEAVQAAMQVAAETKWSEWAGLPGHENLVSHLRDKADWNAIPAGAGMANKGDVAAGAAKTMTGSYTMPFMKHAPIGPSVAVAEVKADGTTMIHTSCQNPSFLRKSMAMMLGVSPDKVTVRSYPGAGHYGRSNGGNSGAEDEAVLLSQAVGRPVRVQWMRAEDMQWSTQSQAALANIKVGLDGKGRIVSYQAEHFGLPMQDDRPVGALLAGKPTIDAPGLANAEFVHRATPYMADAWLYGAIPNVKESVRNTWQIGERESPLKIGLRDHSMRTPVQFQQNFPRELAMSDAAAEAGADALQFRIDHTTDPRVKAVLLRLRDEAGWDTRPSPQPRAAATGKDIVRGRGVSLMLRENGYWACAAHVAVTPETGEVRVERMTLVVDTGIVVNPLQLTRQSQAGCLMGVSEALHEEVTFDKGAITSADWSSYPILTMEEAPELKVVLAPFPGAEVYGQGSESANATAAPAILAAVHDATGKHVRALPLKPDYVKQALTA